MARFELKCLATRISFNSIVPYSFHYWTDNTSLKMSISGGGQMMYISSLHHSTIYTIKMPFTSPSSVYGACKYCLSFHYFSLVCWLIPVFLVSRRSKIQICRKKNFHNVGFFDPDIIHEKSLAQNSRDIVNVIYRGLRKNSMCPFILLPYNHQWVVLC